MLLLRTEENNTQADRFHFFKKYKKWRSDSCESSNKQLTQAQECTTYLKHEQLVQLFIPILFYCWYLFIF